MIKDLQDKIIKLKKERDIQNIFLWNRLADFNRARRSNANVRNRLKLRRSVYIRHNRIIGVNLLYLFYNLFIELLRHRAAPITLVLLPELWILPKSRIEKNLL